jgi:hypothetical protein
MPPTSQMVFMSILSIIPNAMSHLGLQQFDCPLRKFYE